LRQNRPQQTIGDILAAVLHDTVQLAGQLDIPINVVIQEQFRRFRVHLMQHAIGIEGLSHDADILGLFPSVSHATMSDELQRNGETLFTELLREIHRNDRFVNLICDSGTLTHFKVVHAAFSYPSPFSKVIPLEPHENHNWNADQYEFFFQKTLTARLLNDGNRPLEVYGIICDNLPAQVVGLFHFINNKEGPGAGIMHVCCFSHMTNLVFSHAIRVGFCVSGSLSASTIPHLATPWCLVDCPPPMSNCHSNEIGLPSCCFEFHHEPPGGRANSIAIRWRNENSPKLRF
jgi:hypothetical protein